MRVVAAATACLRLLTGGVTTAFAMLGRDTTAQAAVPGVTELRLTRGDFSKCTATRAKKAKKRKPARR
jgi:hypothetical protein